jgi:hypothetical protein
MTNRRTIITVAMFFCAAAGAADEILTRGGSLSVDTADDASLLLDLAGAVWVVPPGGGEAARIAVEDERVSRPRWSPAGDDIVYAVTSGERRGLRIHSTASGTTRAVGTSDWLTLHPTWHPGGERVTFCADRGGSGFDLWEVDLATDLEWRLSGRTGDEFEPAWSADGRDLVYVHRDGDQWSLVLREHGQPEEILVSGTERLAGPAWRPDGSLIMFWREMADGWTLDMAILSEPRLVRRYMSGEDYTTAPVSWLDKHRMFYTAGGLIRQRLFNSWSSRTVPFRAIVRSEPHTVAERIRRNLPRIDEPGGSLVIHAARLFDGVVGSYQHNRDVIIEGGRIRAVEPHAERPGQIVIDMGDLTVMPGLVDAHARLPAEAGEPIGPLLLAAGVTTVVAEHDEAEHLNAVWSGKELPGPRLLPLADWTVGKVSGLADSQTPGLEELLQSRPAALIAFDRLVARRFAELPTIDHGVTDIVLGSRANGLPTGIGTHAELRALQAAGLEPAQALRSAGVNAAAALGVDPRLGRIATGAVADLVLVDGDPLAAVDDALKVIAVVRNGRFYSVAGLIDLAAAATSVE